MSTYTRLFRPLLFSLNPELAHSLSIRACALAGRLPPVRDAFRRRLEFTDTALQTNLGGLAVKNPVGLAAGWDKSGHAARMLGHLGFGFVEIGSISADQSDGNPRPRLFRLPEDRAVVVNYGLPNDGAAVVAGTLRAAGKCAVPLGVNIVKTNRGPHAADESRDDVLQDYLRSVRQVASCCDYLTLNLSCPNAKGGKDIFCEPENIGLLLELLANEALAVPVFLKVVPNADPAFLEALIQQAEPHPFVRGFLFNLAPGKPAWLKLSTPRTRWEKMPGAVSGAPVLAMQNACIRELYPRLPRDRFQIIGVGGIFSAQDAYEKIRLGASVVQLYTAMVYAGPGIVRRINEDLIHLLQRDGFKNVREAVGTAHAFARA